MFFDKSTFAARIALADRPTKGLLMAFETPGDFQILPGSENRIRLSDIGPKRRKPCTHCGTRGRDLCKEGCFMGALYKTRISLLSPKQIETMHATCLKTFPRSGHTSEFEKGNACKPKKKSRK